MKAHNAVAVGGTFDNFHLGHVQLLLKCIETGENIIVGITSDELVKDKNHEIDPLYERKKILNDFFSFNNINKNAITTIILNDPYGPTISNSKISTIIVSEDTLARAIEINKIRENRNIIPLKIIIIQMFKDIDLRPISSTKLKRQERSCEKFFAI